MSSACPPASPVRVSVPRSVLWSALTSVFSRTPEPTPDSLSHRRSHHLSRPPACPATDPAWSRVSPPGDGHALCTEVYLMDDPVLRVQSQLTDRDRVLLGWLYDHGVLTSFQIAHALFPSLDFC